MNDEEDSLFQRSLRLSARSLSQRADIKHSPYLGALQPTAVDRVDGARGDARLDGDAGRAASSSSVLPRSSKSSAFVGFFRHSPAVSSTALSSSQGLKDIVCEFSPKPFHMPLLTQIDLSQKLSYSTRHLDERDLYRLPVATVAEAGSGFAGEHGRRPPNCPICLESFAMADELRVLPCDHSFHRGCVDRWLLGTNSNERCHTNRCPVCNTSAHVPSPAHVQGSSASAAGRTAGQASGSSDAASSMGSSSSTGSAGGYSRAASSRSDCSAGGGSSASASASARVSVAAEAAAAAAAGVPAAAVGRRASAETAVAGEGVEAGDDRAADAGEPASANLFEHDIHAWAFLRAGAALQGQDHAAR